MIEWEGEGGLKERDREREEGWSEGGRAIKRDISGQIKTSPGGL